ncbi:hypothetical protein PENARI_c038G00281 [Penicillium arizonense]|uniref:Uncharacterized protein n=1 Tax=Penicillium arizonense TaxID=1835702 RepID=A0A1F5L491_PENAI|nr:hypothetical protein PENARI_c038G00281 [Penicillium arizonense]OGE47731.1 hypothetical protein PENARI_c038G00281 [Penicillium arizonense]
MANQTPDLPWNLLTSNLHWTSPDYCNCGLKNLLPMHNENQSNDFNEFVKMLAGTLETHAEKSGFFNCEIMKTLLIYGEDGPNLRSDDMGWNNLFFFALRTYLCLNVIYHSPEIWDITSDDPDRKDYRDTAFYQGTLRACTGHATSEVQTFHFRRFFGIEDRQFCTYEFKP